MVGLGVDTQDLPAYASHNILGTAALLAAMARAGVSQLVQASSMVVYGEGRYRCPDHGPVPAPPRSVDDLTTDGSSRPARRAALTCCSTESSRQTRSTRATPTRSAR